MSESGNTVPEPEETFVHISYYSPTVEEIDRAKSIPADGCPRRYCVWWVSARFDWQLTPAEGCAFLRCKKSPKWKHGHTPCCRCDASSQVDHYEPNMPEIHEDGIDATHWVERMLAHAHEREEKEGR